MALDELLLEAAYVTIPPRLEQNLKSYRIGGALKFYDEFGDEVEKEHLESVLRWTFAHAASVPGIVEVQQGIVYKAHPSSAVRAATILAIPFVGMLGILLPYLRSALGLQQFMVPAIPADGQLAGAVALGLTGLLVHLLVAGWKEVRRAAVGEGDSPTLGNWILILHVRYLAAVASVAAVVVASMVAAQTLRETDAVTMMAVGYSADSIMDGILPKALSLLSKRSEVIQKTFST